MVPAETPPPTSHTVVDRTVPITLVATVAVAAVMIAAFWPKPPAQTVDQLSVAEFDDDVTGRSQMIIGLGAVELGGLPPGAVAGLELRLQTPPPAEAGDMSAGITLFVQASTPQLLDTPLQGSISVGSVEGPLALRRIEIEDAGSIVSGMYGEIPWGLVIGLATGAPGAMTVGEHTVAFPSTTQAQVLKGLRVARAKGRTFRTFGVDISQDHPTSPPPASPPTADSASSPKAPPNANPAPKAVEQPKAE